MTDQRHLPPVPAAHREAFANGYHDAVYCMSAFTADELAEFRRGRHSKHTTPIYPGHTLARHWGLDDGDPKGGPVGDVDWWDVGYGRGFYEALNDYNWGGGEPAWLDEPKPLRDFVQLDGWANFPPGDDIMEPDPDGDVLHGGRTREPQRSATTVRIMIAADAERDDVVRIIRKQLEWIEHDGIFESFATDKPF